MSDVQTPKKGGTPLPPSAGSPLYWRSYAKWPEGTVQNPFEGHDVTCDRHATEEQAKGVCTLLHRDGFGGNRQIFPIRTWTEPVYAENAEVRDSMKPEIENTPGVVAGADRSPSSGSEIVRIPVRLGYGENWIGTLEIKAETAREFAAMSIGLKSAPQVSLVIKPDTKMIREIAFGWPPHSPNHE